MAVNVKSSRLNSLYWWSSGRVLRLVGIRGVMIHLKGTGCLLRQSDFSVVLHELDDIPLVVNSVVWCHILSIATRLEQVHNPHTEWTCTVLYISHVNLTRLLTRRFSAQPIRARGSNHHNNLTHHDWRNRVTRTSTCSPHPESSAMLPSEYRSPNSHSDLHPVLLCKK